MKVLIAIITYNEAMNIESTIQELLDNNNGYDFLLIDNASTDNTCALAKSKGIQSVVHCINSGGAMGTVTSYFLYAYLNNYDILCQFDGDGQHIASELCKIIEPIIAKEADYVIGSRFLTKDGFQSYFFRRIGILLFAKLNSFIIRQRVTDVTSGFRAYGKNVIEFFGRRYKHEIHDVNQLLLLSSFGGARIHEVPVKMRERKHGESEFNFINAFSFPFKGLVNILGCLLQGNQIKKIRN